MTVCAVRESLRGATTPLSSYDSTKINLGSLLIQNTGATNNDKWCGPIPISVCRPAEQTVAMPGFMPRAVQWSPTLDWIFIADNAAAAATRRFQMWTFNRAQTGSDQTNAFTHVGTITVTWPTATNFTIRGFEPLVDEYSTGTVAVSGTAVTGTGTAWQTARFAVGARIGFGSTDPTQITTWYNITAIGSDTSITINASAGTVSAGTAFVIEEIRLVVAMTNATATNGGLFIVKGLNPSDFTPAGTAIPASTTVDNIKASFWLADASTVTNTVAGGLTIDTLTDNQNHDCYVINGTTTAQIFKYNLRAALTLASGKSTNAFTYATGVSATLTGTIQQNDSICLASPSHGPGSGVKSLYYVTSTRVYRALLSGVTNGSTTFNSDNMQEVPTGGVAGMAVSASLRQIQYSSLLDRFLISTNGLQAYCTKYNTSTSGYDHSFLCNSFHINPVAASAEVPWFLSTIATAYSLDNCNGILYISRDSATATINQVYNLPVAAHWTYGAGDYARLITPSISTPNATKYYNMYFNVTENIGGAELGIGAEPVRAYYRTSGISDNTGSWTLLDNTGDLSGVGAASSIQFMFEFKVMGKSCVPGRVHNLTVVYETSDSIPGQFEWSFNDSDSSNGTIGFTQIASYGSTPSFTINYYRSDTNANVLTDTSGTNASGQFQYHNGSTWVNGVSTDTIGMRRRYVPSAGLPANVNLYTKLSAS